MDTSIADSLIEGNMSLLNGPAGTVGYKELRAVRGMIYRGNVAYRNIGPGFQLRVPATELLTVLQNTAVGNGTQGIWGPIVSSNVLNNICGFNLSRDFYSATVPGGNNWAKDGLGVVPALKGDPRLSNPDFTINMNFDPSLSVRSKWEFVESQIRNALSPRSDSGLVDQGRIIPGYHCPRADDDPVAPMPKSDPRRHSYGLAPDIGAFESNPARPTAPRNLRVAAH